MRLRIERVRLAARESLDEEAAEGSRESWLVLLAIVAVVELELSRMGVGDSEVSVEEEASSKGFRARGRRIGGSWSISGVIFVIFFLLSWDIGLVGIAGAEGGD